VAASFDDFCRACLDLLKARRTKYIVVGGVAVTALGEPRFTADLDVIVFLDDKGIRRLLTDAVDRGFDVHEATELAALAEGRALRMKRGQFHFDVIVRSLFIEDQALAHASTIKVFRRAVRFPSAEDLLVLKLVAGRPRDLLDAEGIVRRHARTLDRPYVERTLARVCELAADTQFLDRWRAIEKASVGPRRS
jgi:predicted nucleotidyltransferase